MMSAAFGTLEPRYFPPIEDVQRGPSSSSRAAPNRVGRSALRGRTPFAVATRLGDRNQPVRSVVDSPDP